MDVEMSSEISSDAGGHDAHSNLFQLSANFDPCPYASVYKWVSQISSRFQYCNILKLNISCMQFINFQIYTSRNTGIKLAAKRSCPI